MNTELRFLVPGMTCGHCVSAVEEELRKIDGVTAVAIDLDSKVVVVGGTELTFAAVHAAVNEAGYEAIEVP